MRIREILNSRDDAIFFWIREKYAIVGGMNSSNMLIHML